jgi:hypothetical protein
MNPSSDQLSFARTVLEAEAETREALRIAKARSFLAQMAGGRTATQAWQLVALETANEQRAWNAAYIERLLLSYFREALLPQPPEPIDLSELLDD